MWIERCIVDNFHAFRELDASFDRGFNVVLAPNERGKSGLFRAVTTALFTDAGSRSAEVRSLARWGSPDLFRLELLFFIGDRRHRLVRDFRAKTQEVFLDGESAPAARGKAVEAFLAVRLPIADEDLFLRVCGVRHGELARAGDGSANIGERLEEIVGGGGEAAGPARAAEVIDRMRRDLARGLGHPAKEENWGAVKRFTEERVAASAAYEAARSAARRREELSRLIAARRSSLEDVERDLASLATMRDRAARYRDLASREAEAKTKADGLRKRIERLRELSARRGEAVAALERLPEPLRGADAARIAELRGALERESALEHGRETPRAPSRPGPPPGLLAAGLLLLAAGIALGWLRHRAFFAAAAAGIALVALWVLRRRANAASGAAADESDLVRLREERAAWFPGSSRDEARSALEEATRLGEILRDVAARFEEAAGGVSAGLVETLDVEYGAAAVDARALDEQRAALAAFEADADRILAIERELEGKAEVRSRLAAEIENAERARAALPALDAAALAERLEAAEANLALALRRMRVLEIAAASLDEARRAVSGSLAEGLPPRVAPYLSHLTEGRYETLFFDPRTLAVATAPAQADGERGAHAAPAPERIDPGAMSQGARDQLYLAVRLALVDLLGGGESQPLFLDDPFVHFDPARRARALDLVRRFSASHQVVLFTCDPAYRDAGGRVIELGV